MSIVARTGCLGARLRGSATTNLEFNMTPPIAELAPFHQQAEDIGAALERERELAAKAARSGRIDGPTANID